MEAHAGPKFLLELGGQAAEYVPCFADEDGSYTTFLLGTHQACDLVCEGEYASRQHAQLMFARNDFFLVDSSTNGTFIQTEDEQVWHIHRRRIRLWGSGWISLGTPLNSGTPIHFQQISSG